MGRLLLLALAGLAACASAPRPADRSAANLYRDLERLVSLAEARGWEIDRVEVEELLPETLMSVCRTHPASRAFLATWVAQRIEAEGGPVEDAFRRHRALEPIAGLVRLARLQRLLAAAEEAAAADCPFWLTPERPFAGRQILDDRWIVSVGGGGKGMLVAGSGDADFSAGGAGRLLVGRAVGSHWAWLLGAELGGSAGFPRDEEGERGALVLGADVVVPAVVRYRLLNTYLELEAGYLAHVREDDLEPVHGVHAGVSVGGVASRRRWILPGAAFGLSYERSVGEAEPIHWIKLGLRVVIDLPL